MKRDWELGLAGRDGDPEEINWGVRWVGGTEWVR